MEKYCEFEAYRAPLNATLHIIKEHKCNYVADTRNGFEDNSENTKWFADYFMATAKDFGCKIIYFIIDKANSLNDELD